MDHLKVWPLVLHRRDGQLNPTTHPADEVMHVTVWEAIRIANLVAHPLRIIPEELPLEVVDGKLCEAKLQSFPINEQDLDVMFICPFSPLLIC